MIIGNPIGMLALLALPAILAIHFFRQRFRKRPVAGLFLWAPPDHDPSSGRRFHRLERSWSLLLELLLALLLALHLMDFRFGEEPLLTNVVIIVDSSASLGAKTGDFDAAEEVREIVREIIDDAGRQARVTLVATGPHARLLAGPAAAPKPALDALESWTPRERAHDVGPANDLARELAGPRAVVHYVTDHMPRQGHAVDPRIHWHAAGKRLPNIAILAARRERTGKDHDRVFVRLGAFTATTVAVDLQLSAGGVVIDQRRVRIGAGGEQRMTLEIPGDTGVLTVALPDDPLQIDNRALLMRPPLASIRCRNQLAADSVARAALDRALAAVPGIELARTGEPADIAFLPPGFMIAAGDSAWICRIGAAVVGQGMEADSLDLVGPFLMDRAHPLLSDVDLGGVVWGGVTPGAQDASPLISAGDRTLMGYHEIGDKLDIVLNLDLERSTIQKTSDWPVLIHNIIRARRAARPGSSIANIRVGDSLAVRIPRELQSVRLIEPDGDERAIAARGVVTLSRLVEPGAHELRSDSGTLHAFAVNFQDAVVSDLSTKARGDREPEAETVVSRREADAMLEPLPHFTLLGLALAAFLANAFVLRRGAWRRRA